MPDVGCIFALLEEVPRNQKPHEPSQLFPYLPTFHEPSICLLSLEQLPYFRPTVIDVLSARFFTAFM